MAGRSELQGAEVIRLHRLMKNMVTAETGIKAYALVTEQAAEAIGLPEFFAATSRHVENSDEFGDTVCYVYDLAPIYARWRASRRHASIGAPHRGVPEFLDRRVDQLVIA